MNKIDIPRNELKELYFVGKLSMEEISKRYGCSYTTIVHRFKEYGWISRGTLGNRTPIGITKEHLIQLYYMKKYTAFKIASITHHTKTGIESKMRSLGLIGRGHGSRIHFKYKKSGFSGDLDEMAYLIGFRLGDLNVRMVKTVIVVRCSSTIYQQVALIRKLFSPYGGVSITKARRGTYEVNCFVDRTFEFLVPKWRKIPNWILGERNLFLAFLAGYSDAEGYFDTSRNGLRISSQQRDVIFQCCEGLVTYGFPCNAPRIVRRAGHRQSDGVVNNKDMWSFAIYKSNTTFELLKALTPYLQHLNKMKAAATIVKQLLSKNI